ncbi:MAG: RNA 2',3'-cyclic phosphodiesterase [Planctomycetaceae bacterium]|nr:RNA 2',3'-cyclic phosphodiesterase [Planctomycetaceae bacterium]
MSPVRTFIAVEISQDVRLNIERWVRSLRHKVSGVKWVETHNLHVTLKFLGDVAADEVPKITDVIMKAVAQAEPFELEFFGCGAFPNAKAPRTLWVGCRDGAEPLTRIVSIIDGVLAQHGFPKETRPFSPHLTIGRAKHKVADMTALLVAKQSELFGKCRVTETVLFSSNLTPSGPVYKKLADLPLR